MKHGYKWLLQNLDTGGEAVFDLEHIAMHEAERIVGNRSYAKIPDGYLYGRGDGNTVVMLREMPEHLCHRIVQ